MLLKSQSSIWTTLKNVNSRFDDIIQLNTQHSSCVACPKLPYISCSESLIINSLAQKVMEIQSLPQCYACYSKCKGRHIIPKLQYSNCFLVHFVICMMLREIRTSTHTSSIHTISVKPNPKKRLQGVSL